MRVLFFYKYLTLGGVEAVLRARLEGLDQWGIDAHAWFLSDGPGRSMFAGVESRIHLGDLGTIEDHLQTQAYDVVVSIDTEEVFPVLKRLPWSARLVLEVHSPYRENVVYLRWLRRLHIAAFFVPSFYQASIIRKKIGIPAPVHMVPNPLREIFAAPAAQFTPPPSHPVVAWVGRLDNLKNWTEFLEAAAILSQRGCGAEFWLVGQGEGLDPDTRLYRKAKETHVLGRLRWFKSFRHERMPALFDAVRESGGVVLSTSRHESFGMTVAEAMSRRCAVVVPSGGPFVEFVSQDQEGRLYKLGSPRDAADQVERLLRDSTLRNACGERARKRILRRHGPYPALQALAEALKGVSSGAGLSDGPSQATTTQE